MLVRPLFAARSRHGHCAARLDVLKADCVCTFLIIAEDFRYHAAAWLAWGLRAEWRGRKRAASNNDDSIFANCEDL